MAIDYGILITDEWLPRPPTSLTCQLTSTYEPGEEGIIVIEMRRSDYLDAATGAIDYDAYRAHLMDEFLLLEDEAGRQVSDDEKTRAGAFFDGMVNWMKRKDATTVRLQMWW